MKVSNVATRTQYESEQCCNGGHVLLNAVNHDLRIYIDEQQIYFIIVLV